MPSSIDSPWNHTGKRLQSTFVAAIILHSLLLFGLGFSLFPPSEPALSLEVTFAQTKSKSAPRKPDFLAQADQLGSGDLQEKSEITTDLLSEFQNNHQGQVPTPQQAQLQPSDARLLARQAEQNRSELVELQPLDQEQINQPQLDSTNLGAIRAKLDQLKQVYSKLPRVLRMTAASTKSAEEAAYMRYFEERIEHIGNINYPEEARTRNIYGKVQLLVVLIADGSVQQVEISKSSGSHILDQAAIRSVRLASPFKAFPPELRDRDEVHIIRTWQYRSDNRLTTRQ